MLRANDVMHYTNFIPLIYKKLSFYNMYVYLLINTFYLKLCYPSSHDCDEFEI